MMLAEEIPISNSRMKQYIFFLLGALCVSAIAFLLLYRLESWPPVWWDEGWTLDAARNWILHGHLGHYLDGVPVPPRIPVRLPVLLPVAISMKLLGIGIWQGRIPGVIFTLLSITLSAYICRVMYNRRTGFIALVTTLIIVPFVYHPLVMGRQILAEMPVIFFLLGGYSLLWLSLSRSPAWGIGAAFLFGVALHAKLQVPPFWLLSMLLAIWMSVSRRQRHSMLVLVGVTFGSLAFAALVYWVQNRLMPGSFSDPELIKLLINSVIVVMSWRIRLIAMIIVLIYALPQLLSLVWAGKRLLPSLRLTRPADSSSSVSDIPGRDIMRIAIWGLGAGWFFWYLALGLSWERYLFPPFFIGCLFFAAYLDELTAGLTPPLVMVRAAAFLFHRKFDYLNFQSILLLVVLGLSFGTLGNSIRGATAPPSADPLAAAAYLENNLPTGARLEMFESELLFLAPGLTFHYPSDLLSMQLNRKTSIDPQFPALYDPMESHPDYLVRGPMGRLWHLYDDAIDNGLFQLEADIGGYQIYRNRSTLLNK